MQNSVENSVETKKIRPSAIKSIDKRTIEILGQADRGEIGIKAALMSLGIAEKQAGKGWATVRTRRGLREALAAYKAEELVQLRADEAPKVEAEQDMARINARLRRNIEEGSDSAVQSCKLLGSRKDLNMWTADSVAGMVVIAIPTQLPSLDAVPMIDGTTGKLLDSGSATE